MIWEDNPAQLIPHLKFHLSYMFLFEELPLLLKLFFLSLSLLPYYEKPKDKDCILFILFFMVLYIMMTSR